MPARKGSYNARRYHEEAADGVEAALRRALASRRLGMAFRNVSALAAHVAPACGRTAGQLRRNRRYRAILEDHIARQPGAAGLLGDEIRSVAVLRAKLDVAILRVSNLERDKKRLEAFVVKHLPNVTAPRPAGGKSEVERGPDYRRAFECAAAALDALIRHAEVYDVDPRSGALVDRSAHPGSPPVIRSHLLADFLRWRKAGS
jgi:hypothetical protein